MTINLFEALNDKTTRDRILDRAAPEIPEDAKTWLGRLTLLYGVPFQYLVPDERMLPPESLRFFHVDPLWMEALLDGALSVGRPEDVRLLLNKAMAGTYAQDLIAEARKIRPQQQAGPDGTAQVPAPPPIKGAFAFSGFFLRSEIVAGWRGLAVSAYPDKQGRKAGGPLATLRLERLARDVLFGLFEGYLHSLEINQPPEGLHFELPDTSKFVDHELRVLDVAACRSACASAQDNSAGFAISLVARSARYTFSIED